jgi:anti-sigma regulatory factor (Ser/Thr protein kinase)
MCATTERAETLLSASPSSPAAAREFARRSGCPEHVLAVLDDALLLISELVTNSVVHGRPPILLTIDCEESALRVRVRDGSPATPRARAACHSAEGGRGLRLLADLSDAWGVDPIEDDHGRGKTVWFVLRTTAG